MISQPHTPDIDDIIIAYHTYVTEDGTYSQEFEVSRDEVDRALVAAEQRGAARGWDAAIDHAWDDSSIYEADAKRIKAANPCRADQEGAQGE